MPDVDASNCTVHGFVEHAVVRTPMTFALQARDAAWNPVHIGGADVRVAVRGGPSGGASGRVDDEGDGTYRVRWEAAASGTYAITIGVNGIDVPGCPFVCRVAELRMPRCTTHGDGRHDAVAGELASFTLSFDAPFTDNCISCELVRQPFVTEHAAAHAEPRDARVAASVSRLSARAFRVAHTARAAGDYSLSVRAEGRALGHVDSAGLVRVRAGPVCPPACELRLVDELADLSANRTAADPGGLHERRSGLAVLRAGVPLVLRVHMRDAFGNTIDDGAAPNGAATTADGAADGTLAVAVGVRGPGVLSWRSAREADGAWLLRTVPRTSGEYALHVAHASGAPFVGSPLRVCVLPRLVAARELGATSCAPLVATAGALCRLVLRAQPEADEAVEVEDSGGLCAQLMPSRLDARACAGSSDGDPPPAPAPALVSRARGERSGWRVEYVARRAGEYTLSVTCARTGEHVRGSPFGVRVLPAEPDARASRVERAPATLLAGAGGTVVVRARDRFGNDCLVGGELGFSARLYALRDEGASECSAHDVTADLHDGRYEMLLRAELLRMAGAYHMRVLLRGDAVGGAEGSAAAPLVLRVLAGRAHARACVAHGRGLVVAEAHSVAEFEVRTADEFGNATPANEDGAAPDNARPGVTVEVRGPCRPTSCRVWHAGGALYRACYPLPLSGRFCVHVCVHGQPVPGSPFVVHALRRPRAPPLAPRSAHEMAERPTEGEAQSQRRAGAGARFVGSGDGASSAPPLAPNGGARAAMPLARARDARDDDDDDDDAAAAARLARAPVSSGMVDRRGLHRGCAHCSRSQLELADGEVPVVGATLRLRLLLRDGHGLPACEHASGAVRVFARGPVSVHPPALEAGAERGELSLSFEAPISGEYALSATLGGSHVRGSPLLVRVHSPSAHAAHSRLRGGGALSARAGDDAVFDVEARDVRGELVLSPPRAPPFCGWVASPSGRRLKLLVTAAGDGVHRFSFVPTESGEHSLHVLLRGGLPHAPAVALRDSPFRVAVSPAEPDARASDVQLLSAPELRVGDSAILLVRLRDRFGNQLRAPAGAVRAALVGPADAALQLVESNDGAILVRARAHAAGAYAAHMTLGQAGAAHIRGSPLDVAFAPGALTPRACTVGVLFGGRAGEGLQLALVPRDANGNRLSPDSSTVIAMRVRAPVFAPKALRTHVRADQGLGAHVLSFVPPVHGVYNVSMYVNGGCVGRAMVRVEPQADAESAVTLDPQLEAAQLRQWGPRVALVAH